MVLFTCIFYLNAMGRKEEVLEQKPLVAVSILPQSYFMQQIADSSIDILVLVGEGQSPHSYEPTPTQIANLSKAQVWILSGTDFEFSFEKKIKALFPSINIIDGTEGIRFRELNESEKEEGEFHEADCEEHNAEGFEHTIDRHTWLGRENAKIMASHMYKILIKINPSLKDFYTKNYHELIASIDETFTSLAYELTSLRGKSILVFHPSFGYFLDEFGIKQLSIETGGKEPSARILAELIDRAKKEHIPAIFVQKQFPVSAAHKIASETGAKVVPLDPLSADWLLNIQAMGKALKEVYN